MEKQKYIMIGAKTITRELFRNVLRPLYNYTFLPTGGFWSCIYNKCNISEWFDYLIDNDYLIEKKDITSAIMFTLKDTAKILVINSYSDLEQTINKYPSYHHKLNFYKEITSRELSINFELLSKDYDGIFINHKNFMLNPNTIIFDDWAVDTLLLFNLDVIESYTKVNIEFYLPGSYAYHGLKKDSSVSFVEEESIYHKEIVRFIQALFNALVNQKSSFNDYDEYFKYLTECTRKCIEIGIAKKEKEASNIRELLKEKNIQTTNYIIIRNICTNVLSNYLRDNVSIEEKLPKTKVRKCREYPIE